MLRQLGALARLWKALESLWAMGFSGPMSSTALRVLPCAFWIWGGVFAYSTPFFQRVPGWSMRPVR